ncbi:hypothetical protein [Natrinema versiforme]|uniref:Uncharacterized protein n=1 Tax=Natrinema versiforme TaxID=88724 RepID=A0A4P8WKL4_9EURY|nr:hypothetical protein [Natrinema versiforme]QCS43632.1 hypothetical protein FEJ81_15205 [Natrinema versiforme]
MTHSTTVDDANVLIHDLQNDKELPAWYHNHDEYIVIRDDDQALVAKDTGGHELNELEREYPDTNVRGLMLRLADKYAPDADWTNSDPVVIEHDTDRTDDSIDNEYSHPIPTKYVSGAAGGVSEDDVNELLEAVDDSVNEKIIHDIDAATDYENYFENDHACAAYTDVTWEGIFDEIGLALESGEHTVEYADHAQQAVRLAHERFAVNELGMDHNQPVWILVSSKDE